MSNSLQSHGLYSPWNSPGQNTGVGSRSLLQGIFPTQGSNLGLLHCRRILYSMSHQGSPRILVWLACPFSRLSSPSGNRTGVSCITGRFFTRRATREARRVNASWITFAAAASNSLWPSCCQTLVELFSEGGDEKVCHSPVSSSLTSPLVFLCDWAFYSFF